MKSLLIAGAMMVIAGTASAAEPFSFVALGDVPYGKPEKVYKPFEALIGEINKAKPAFAVHIGDTKSGGTECSDQMLLDQLNFMNAMETAVLYTPGDNEWTDCHRKKAGKMDPLERLDFIRKNYFTAAETLGKTKLKTIRQSDTMPGFEAYVENARFTYNDVMVIGAHIMGSNNNFEVRNPKAVAEFFDRDKANIAWLNASFDAAIAEGAKAVVLGIHADMFRGTWNQATEGWDRHSGFLNVGKVMVKKAAEFGKPVLLVFGDSHVYRVFRPFAKTAPNVMGLEVFGSKNMHAVEVAVDPEHPAVFGIHPLLNPTLPLVVKKDGKY